MIFKWTINKIGIDYFLSMIEYNQKVSVMIYGTMLEAFPLKAGQEKDSFYYHYNLIFFWNF